MEHIFENKDWIITLLGAKGDVALKVRPNRGGTYDGPEATLSSIDNFMDMGYKPLVPMLAACNEIVWKSLPPKKSRAPELEDVVAVVVAAGWLRADALPAIVKFFF